MLDILPSEPIADIDGFAKARRQLEENLKKQEDIKADLEDEADDTDEAVIHKRQELDSLLTDTATLKNKIDVFVSGIENFDSVTLSENITKLMKRYGLTMQDLETLLGVSNGYVARTMGKDSKKRLSIDIVWKIAKLFQVNVSDLVNVDIDPPVAALKPVLDFVESLIKQTRGGVIHWENHGKDSDEMTKPLFSFGNGKTYAPEKNGNEKCVLCEDIYTIDSNIGVISFTKNTRGDRSGFDIYTIGERYDPEADKSYALVSKIFATHEEKTGRVEKKCEELLEEIKLHASDFVVSDTAKDLIDRFLGRGEYDPEALPFK